MTTPYTSSPYYKRGYGNFRDRQGLAATQGRVMDDERNQGNVATGNYLDYATNFDASKGLNDFAKGAYGTISEQLDKRLKDLTGSAVGAGRLNTGFFDEDQGEVVRGAQRDFSNAIASQAVNAQGQQLQNAEGLASFGQGQQRDANDLLTSRREELENAYREEQARKRKSGFGGFIGGALGGIAGSAIPAIGTAIGGALGKKVGGLFG